MADIRSQGAAPKLPSMSTKGKGSGPSRFVPGEKPKNAGKTLLRIMRLYLNWGRTIFAAAALTALSAVISVTIPYFVGRTFDYFPSPSEAGLSGILTLILSILVALNATNWLLNTISGVLMLRVTQRLVFSLRGEFFDKMQRLPLSFFDTRSHGDTMSRLTNDVDNISSTIAQTTTQMLSSILTVCGSVAVMAWLSLPLTLVVLLCIPLVALLTKVIATHSRAHFLGQQRSLGQLNGIIEENIQGLKIVKAFARQEEVLSQFERVNEELYQNSLKAQIWSGYMMPLMNVINNLIFTLVAVTGGMLCARTGLAVSVVISFLSYSKQFGHPLNAIAGMFNTIQSALAGAERVFEVLDLAEEPADPENPETFAPQASDAGHVVFEDVSFSYDGTHPVLDRISFEAAPGETIALVGETGAGKTTVVNLLTRFYDADSGRIFIDGHDIRRLRRSSLRSRFSVVLQETCLFTGTIMDNIRYSKPEATDRQVIEAAKLACAHSFIERLPQGYKTMVSGSSDTLSQGQRQLLSIARALLCDCPILILDEATSSVDTKTEKDIQRALLTLMKNRTSFLIAHRLSTIRDANRILVMGDGHILEAGTHAQLMSLRGSYYRMVISQMGIPPA